jgi:hypothetical protein
MYSRVRFLSLRDEATSSYVALRRRLGLLQLPEVVWVNVARRAFEFFDAPLTRLLFMVTREVAITVTHYARSHTSRYLSGPLYLVKSTLERSNGVVSVVPVLFLFRVSTILLKIATNYDLQTQSHLRF